MIYKELKKLKKAYKFGNIQKHQRILFEHPHLTADNFFSGDDSINYAAEKGFGLTMTFYLL